MKNYSTLNYFIKKISDKLKSKKLDKLSIIFNNYYLNSIQKFLYYFYKNTVKNSKIETIYKDCFTSKQNIKNPVWVFWDTGIETAPEIVKLCYSTLKKVNPDMNVILLTAKNYSDFITFPDFIEKKYKDGLITKAQFSDILRFGLLTNYGGIWIDSTIYVTQPFNPDIFTHQIYSIKNNNYYKWNISKRRWTSYFWYIQKNSYFAKNVYIFFLEYWNQHDELVDYFLIDHIINLLYENDSVIRELIDSIPTNNPEVTNLQPILDTDFNENKLKELQQDTYLFKLNWKAKINTEKENTFYKFILTSNNN